MSLRVADRMRGVERTLIRQIFDAAPPGSINLGLGEPDLPTPDACALAGVRAIADHRTAYSSTAGLGELRGAVAEAYAPFARGAESVCITVGSQEAMFASCLALVDAGDELLYPDPGYPAYPIVARLIGARATPYPLRPERGFRPDPEDVLGRVTDRTRVVILCLPSNPTGAVSGAPELEELVRGLADRGVPWLSDEIYADFVWNPPFVSPCRIEGGGGIVVSGLSKGLSMTGWRVGWVVGPAETVGRITAAHQYLVTCAPTISQAAGIEAFGPSGDRARARHREILWARRELMGQLLGGIEGLRFTPPDGGFYYFVDASAHGDSLDVARRILDRQGVVVIPGEAFGAGGRGWLRLSFGASEASIRTGLARIAAELGNAG